MVDEILGQGGVPTQQAGSITVLNGPTILAGQSLSDGIDCTAGTLVRITMPAPDWTPANMTFQFSSDGNQYNDMFDQFGNEVTLPNMPPGVGVVLSHVALASLAWIKIRSGTRKYPVKQEGNRVFALAVQAP
jgi:hypothetical protein